ncbi:MAG: FecR family protein [Eubacteriales bacterium]
MRVSEWITKRNIIIAVAACVVILGAILLMVLGSKETISAYVMRIESMEGSVVLRNSNQEEVDPSEGMRMFDGHTLSTGDDSYALISLDDSKAVQLNGNSDLTFVSSGKHLELVLTQGELFFEVSQKLEDDETFNIRTSNMVTGIRGTSGYVTTISDTLSLITLLTGEVSIQTINSETGEVEEVIIEPGNTTLVDTSGEMTEVTIAPTDFEDLPDVVKEYLRDNEELLTLIEEQIGVDIRPYLEDKIEEIAEMEEEIEEEIEEIEEIEDEGEQLEEEIEEEIPPVEEPQEEVVEEPIVEEPIVEEPIVEEAIIEEPVAEQEEVWEDTSADSGVSDSSGNTDSSTDTVVKSISISPTEVYLGSGNTSQVFTASFEGVSEESLYWEFSESDTSGISLINGDNTTQSTVTVSSTNNAVIGGTNGTYTVTLRSEEDSSLVSTATITCYHISSIYLVDAEGNEVVDDEYELVPGSSYAFTVLYGVPSGSYQPEVDESDISLSVQSNTDSDTKWNGTNLIVGANEEGGYKSGSGDDEALSIQIVMSTSLWSNTTLTIWLPISDVLMDDSEIQGDTNQELIVTQATIQEPTEKEDEK